jgi:hypothetical protein
LFVLDRPVRRYQVDQLLRHLSYLLYRRTSLYRHSDLAPGVCFVSVVFTGVSSAVRSRLRRLGNLYARGIFADLVWRATCASGDTFAESTARPLGVLRKDRKRGFRFQKGFDRTGRLS